MWCGAITITQPLSDHLSHLRHQLRLSGNLAVNIGCHGPTTISNTFSTHSLCLVHCKMPLCSGCFGLINRFGNQIGLHISFDDSSTRASSANKSRVNRSVPHKFCRPWTYLEDLDRACPLSLLE